MSGGANIVAKVVADEKGREAVEAILNGAKDEVGRLLRGHRHVLEALRDALLLREELIGDEILDVIRQAEAEVVDLTAITLD